MLSNVLQDLLEEGIQLLGEHLVLVVSAMLIASVIAIPAGVLLTTHPRGRRAALAIASIGQTIPSLALFGFLIPIPFIGGIGQHTAIIALVIYALLPILRNTVTGILGVDPVVRDSALAMGMTRAQILRMVELPLAAPTIIAGLRIAAVTTVGTATIAAAIGAGGLGVFIFRGIASVDKMQILAGAVPSALLALAADGALGWVEKRMRGALIACVALLAAGCSAGCSQEPRLRVGSKNFSEQLVLGEIVAQHLENRLHGHVSRRLDLGGTLLAHQALVAGDIDVYPEYTGTALTAVLKQKPLKDPSQVLAAVREGYRQWHLEWLDPLGFENTFAMAVRSADARARRAATLSEAARSGSWRLGAGYEFAHREDGLPGLLKVYGLRLTGAVRTMDLGLLYQALSRGQVDLVAGNSTDGMLSVLPITVLDDDRHYFPPYECALVVRESAERQFPGLRAALSELSGRISSDTMRRLNYELDGQHRPAREIARDFLRSAGLQ